MSVRLPPLPALRDFIHMYHLSANSRLSQNYLMDMNLTRKIVNRAGRLTDAHVVEVGPGPGGITRALLEQRCRSLDVIEIDRRFLPALQHLAEVAAPSTTMRIHHGDVLRMDMNQLWTEHTATVDWMDEHSGANLHIVGNLPFHISTPLIVRWLRAMADRSGVWRLGRVPLTLTFQREVAERLVAPLADKQRCRLSIVCQCFAEPTLLFTIPGQCFVPAPAVQVSVVRFVPRAEPLIKCHFSLVEKLCRHLFHYRQKQSIKAVKTLYPVDLRDYLADEMYRRCRINPRLPCTQLHIAEIRDMCFVYHQQCMQYPGLFLYDYRNRAHSQLSELQTRINSLPPSYAHNADEVVPSHGMTLRQFNANLSISVKEKEQHQSHTI